MTFGVLYKGVWCHMAALHGQENLCTTFDKSSISAEHYNQKQLLTLKDLKVNIHVYIEFIFY